MPAISRHLSPILAFFVFGILFCYVAISQAHAQEQATAPSTTDSPAIVGGEEVDPGEYPWQALLINTDDQFACGGTLIAPRWVLTAGHCVYRATIDHVILGVHDRQSRTEPNRQTISVLRTIRHPHYNNRTVDHDIALLELSVPAMVTTWVKPLDDIATSENETLFAAGVDAIVTGWGTTGEDGPLPSVLHEVSVPIVDHTVCYDVYNGDVTTNMLCAGLKDGGKDSCQGDSGGPLIVPSSTDGWTLAGIVSWGNGCARPNFYGVYTKVANYHEWISQQIAQFTPTSTPVIPTAAPTVQPTPIPTTIEKTPTPHSIRNGDFEAGRNSDWREKSTRSVPLIDDGLPVIALSGRYAAWLGRENRVVDRLIQQLSLPKSDTLYLVFGYQIRSHESRCDRDVGKVFLNAKRLFKLALCKDSETTTWQRVAVDISRYANDSQKLQFYTATSKHDTSSWFIDDIFLVTSIEGRLIDQILAPEDIDDEMADETINVIGDSDDDDVDDPDDEDDANGGGGMLQSLYLPIVQR